jgi:hypothetical protein
MTLQIGYAQTDITPALARPVYLAGFGQDRRAEAIHDPLWARALAISDDQTTLVLCALDLIGLFRPDVIDVIDSLKTSETFAKFKPEVIIAATHTHHGPDTLGLWGPNSFRSGVDRACLKTIKDQIAATILKALEHLEPGNVKCVSIKAPGLIKNPRDPQIVDDELTLLQFLDPGSGRALASLYNFPCPPEVLGEKNPHITADYVYPLRESVELVTHGPCIFFTGALGGMMTPDVKERSFAEAERMGKALAAIGLGALRQAAVDDRLFPLQITKLEIKIPLRNWKFLFGMLLDVLPRKALRLDRTITTEVNLVRIGPLWLAGVPGELFPKIGLQIKAEMRKAGAPAVGILGLANDELGYILPAEDFHSGFEEGLSVGPEIGPRVLDALRKLIEA